MQTKILIILFICHFLADYTHFSTAWMLNAKKLGKPLFPIWVHAMVHGLLMFWGLMIFCPVEICAKMFIFQWLTHFAVDVWKGKMNAWFPTIQSPTNKLHWIVFGLDQTLHAIVIIIMSMYAVA